MIKLKKIILTVLCTSTLAATLSGCSEDTGPGYLTEDGKIPSYSMDEIADGYYLLSATDGRCYQGFTAGAGDTTYKWLTEDMDKAIPILTPNDQLIVKQVGSRPSTFTFTSYIDYGYTIGTNFTIINDTEDVKTPTIITFGGITNPYSPIGAYLEQAAPTKGTENVKILEINGKDFKASMLTTNGYLKGLTKNAMYKFTYYEGTYYKDVTLKADSHLFLADTIYTSSSYSEMKSNYFIINIPSSLTKGYYILDGFGLFYYTGVDTALGEEINKVIEDEDATKQPPMEEKIPEDAPAE